MKKNRYLPFGYHIQNGALCIHETEAAVVRQVFEDYQAGTSYSRIAEIKHTLKRKMMKERNIYMTHIN